jgi:hypothetical protein
VFDLEAIASCSEVNAEIAQQAASSPYEMKRFLARIAEVARPEEGCPKVLMAVAKLAFADWVEGDVRAELSGDDKGTTMTIYCEHGVGIRERLLAPHYFAVPIDEFQRAVLLVPKLVLPLIAQQGLNRLTLAPRAELENAPIPSFELDEQSLGDGERITVKPPPGTGFPAALEDDESGDEDVHTRPTKPPVMNAEDGE